MRTLAMALALSALVVASTNAAPTFSDPSTVASGSGNYDVVAAASADHLYVAWVNVNEQTAHDLLFRGVKADGSTDGDIREIMTAPTLSLYPSIAAAGDAVVVVWLENDHDHPGNDDKVYVDVSTDRGATWGDRKS